MRIFILSYDYVAVFPIKDQFSAYISRNRNIIQWLQPFDGLYLLKSNVSLFSLQQDFHSFLVNRSFFLAETTADQCQGWLPPYVWEWVRSPAENSLAALLPSFPPPIRPTPVPQFPPPPKPPS
jgi:hypothetical protein